MKNHTILLLCLLLTGFVLAIAPTGVDSYGWKIPEYLHSPPNETATNALYDLIDETGATWTGRWNPSTGLPHRLFAGGYPFPIIDGDDLEAKCLRFVDDHPALFGQVGSDKLEAISIKYRNKVWYAIFAQRLNGIRVEGARVDFRVKHGNLVMFGADVISELEPIGTPAISLEQAVSTAHSGYDFDSYQSELVYLAPANGVPAWKINGYNDSPVRNWAIYINASTGEIMYAFDETKTHVRGTVYSTIHNLYGTDTPESRPQPYIYVGLSGYTADTADVAGDYWIDIDPGSGWDISGKLEGLYTKAVPRGDLGAEVFITASDSVIDLRFETPDADLDEMDAYYHTNIVHNWIKEIAPELTGMDYQVPVYVRETTDPGPNNAWWDGYAVHMGAGAGGYDNWGYYADVYYHEYGHGITEKQYPAGTLPYTGQSGAIDEACSDYTASTITDEPDVGEGGLIPGGGMLRSMDNTFVYPDDWEGEVHADGRIIGGAFWDLRVAVGANIADTLITFAKYGAPEEFEAFLDEVLIVDDDDGDLLNGTPHFHEIYTAFQNHGIGRFRISFYHTPIVDSENLDGPYYAKCFIASTLPPDGSSIILSYSHDGGIDWHDIPMTSTGVDRLYECDIPGIGSPAEYYYYISACDTVGICGTEPDSAPDYYHSFIIDADMIDPVIVHNPLTPVAADAAPYEIKFNATDNMGLEEVIVVWNLNGASDETLSVIPDTLGNCTAWINPVSLAVGDSFGYYIVASDSAEIPNNSIYPESGYHWVDVIRGIFLDFESSDGSFTEVEGWEWGEPDPSISAHSGDKCWGTQLIYDYTEDANYVLNTEAFDLSDWASATLEMWSYYNCEELFDGGNVWVSSDAGMRWYVLQPIGGYPSVWVDALREPGFTGDSDGWKKHIYDLTPYMDSPYGHLLFQFVFKSNDRINGHGWFIDDFALLERQLILPAGRITAESGHDGEIPIHWKPPDPTGGSATRSPMEFLGYNVYRADTSGGYSSTPLNATTLTDTVYSDTDVVNENTYYYRVTVVYAEGESEPTSEVSATPYNARLSVWPESLYVEVTQGPDIFDTTLMISNIGDGWLDFDVIEYTYYPGTRAPRIRLLEDSNNLLELLQDMWSAGEIEPPTSIATTVPPSPDNWRHIIHDPDEFWATRDIRDVYAQHDVNNFWLKLDSYGPMGEPGDNYAVGFTFDIDLDPSTGSPEFYGVEYIVATGELGFPVDGVILAYDSTSEYGFDIAGFPHWVMNTFDSVGIGISKTDIGNPPSTYLMAVIVNNLTTTPVPEDIAPDLGEESELYVLSDAWWISEDPIAGTATPGSPQDIDIAIEVPYMSPGEYYAWLMIESSDRIDPNEIVPIVCKVNPVGVDESRMPVKLSLDNPSPNPFNASCKLSFTTPGGRTSIEIFDISGRKVRTLYDGELQAGHYSSVFDGVDDANSELPTGVYFTRLVHDKNIIIKKLMLVK